MRQKGDMKFHNEDTQMFGTIVENCRSGDLAPGICASLGMFTITSVSSSTCLFPMVL